MANAVQFLLAREQGFWQAAQAQAQAITARVNLATAKVQYAGVRLDALTSKANYALTKLKLATEDAQYGQAKFQLDVLLPLQEDQLTAQIAMINEQKEAQRAQTMNTRSDATPVAGLLGKQKDLYAQQITSYQRDAEVKAVKLFTDLWTINKSVDESVPVPNIAAVAIDGSGSLNNMLNVVKTNNGL